MSSCSFAGTPLCIDTPPAMAWVNAYIPLDNSRITQAERRWPGSHLLGLTYPNRYPTRPNLQVGHFFYPTGLSRYAEVHFLITGKEADALTGVTSGTFTMSQGDVEISTEMFMLPPRPLGVVEDFPGLYLLTLVDDRYFLQDANAGEITIMEGQTWKELLDDLIAVSGLDLTYEEIDLVYAHPHPLSDLGSHYANVGVLLDAALWNVGQLVHRNLDGTYTATSAATAVTSAQDQVPDYRLAGGEVSPLLPTSITTTFLERNALTGEFIDSGLHLPYVKGAGKVFSVVVPTAGTVGKKTFHCTAEAWVDGGGVTNLADVEALATQLAADYVDWNDYGLDLVIPSIFGWEPESLHDLTWCWSATHCYTRIARKPYNQFWPEEFMHHFPHLSSSSSVSSSSVSSSGSSSSVSSNSGSNSGSGSGSTNVLCIEFVTDVDVQCINGVIQTTLTKECICIPNAYPCSSFGVK